MGYPMIIADFGISLRIILLSYWFGNSLYDILASNLINEQVFNKQKNLFLYFLFHNQVVVSKCDLMEASCNKCIQVCRESKYLFEAIQVPAWFIFVSLSVSPYL